MRTNGLVIMVGVISGIGLGLVISKIETKLSWKQLITLKYKVLILAPILRFICNNISRKKCRLGKLYKLRNKLQEHLFKQI